MSFDLSQAGSYLFRLVARARRRKFRVDLVEATLDALFCLSFLVAAFFLLDRIRLEVWPRGSCLSPREWIFSSVVTAAALSLAYGLGRAWWRVASPLATAKGIDDAFGLQDRVGTSLDVVEGRAAGRLGPMVVADTVRAMQALDIRRAFPFAAPGVRALSALAVGVTLWLAWLPLPSPAVTATEQDPYVIGTRGASGDESSGNDPYVRFDKLPNDPKNTPPKAWKPPKEKEYPPYNHEKPPKPDPPSALPSPDFNPKPQPKEGAGGGGGGKGGGGGGGQKPPPKEQQPPPKGSGGQQPGGGGGDNPLFGPKERVPVNLLPKEVKPLLGQGHGKVKEMAIDDGSGDPGTGAGGAPAASDFKTLYQQYKGVMESALPQERVSVEDRDLVKRYFQEIEPR